MLHYYYFIYMQNKHMYVVISLTGLLALLSASGRMTDAAIHATTPTNLTVLEGSKIKFGCETNTGSKIRWNFYKPGSNLPVVLHSGYNVVDNLAGRLSVNISARSNEIIINNVGVDDSGNYTCHEVEKFIRKVIFQLSVKGNSATTERTTTAETSQSTTDEQKTSTAPRDTVTSTVDEVPLASSAMQSITKLIYVEPDTNPSVTIQEQRSNVKLVLTTTTRTTTARESKDKKSGDDTKMIVVVIVIGLMILLAVAMLLIAVMVMSVLSRWRAADVATSYKSDRCARRQHRHSTQEIDEYHGTAIYRRGRYRASEPATQPTISDGEYIEIIDSSSQDAESRPASGDYDHYDRPESVYEGLDASTVDHQEAAPVPSVYDALTH